LDIVHVVEIRKPGVKRPLKARNKLLGKAVFSRRSGSSSGKSPKSISVIAYPFLALSRIIRHHFFSQRNAQICIPCGLGVSFSLCGKPTEK